MTTLAVAAAADRVSGEPILASREYGKRYIRPAAYSIECLSKKGR